MNIALLSYEYPPDTGFGGIGTYTWYHARALARLGHRVHVLAGQKEKCPLNTREHDGVLVHRYRPGGPPMKLFQTLGRWRCYWTRQRLENAWGMYRALARLRRRYQFDIVEMPECGAEGLLVNSLMNMPSVVRFHSPARLIMPFYDVPEADRTMCSWLEQRAIRHAVALTSCSQFLADEARTKLGIGSPIGVIPNGIDLGLFDRDAPLDVASKYGLPEGKPIVLFTGRMERRKGIHLCAEIAAPILRDHDVAFVFAGQDLFGYMENTVLPALRSQQRRGTVHYIGKLGQPELRALLRTADIVLLPSLWENCPYACLEAMAARRAIVSTDQGGMPELIRDGENGLLCRSESPESFVQQLDAAIRSRELRDRLGSAARETMERDYSDDRTARLSTAVYEKTLSSREVQRGRKRLLHNASPVE